MALGGEVELRLAVGDRGRHRQDVAVARVDRDDRRRRADVAHLVLDRLAGLVLELEVDRRVDAQAAELDRGGAVLLDQLRLDVVEHVALARPLVVALHVQPEALGLRGRGRGLGDHPQLGHLAQDLVAALLGLRRREDRRVGRRRLRHAGEHRRLAQRQVLHALVEVQPRGRADADRRLAADRAVRDRVEVLGQHPVLGVRLLQLARQLGLADLALVAVDALARAVLGVEVAHELHGQRRGALHGLVLGEVLDRGADDALVVDALVLVEALVLDRDGRVLQRVRDLLAVHRLHQVVGLDEAEPRAVGREDLRERARIALLERGQRRCGGGCLEHPGDRGTARQRPDQEHDEEAEQEVPARSGAAATPPHAG